MQAPVPESGPVTVIATWRIRKGCDREFEAWRQEISAAALEFPGHMGINVIPPVGENLEYVVIFRFDSYQNLRNWQDSAVHERLLKKAEPLVESKPTYQLESGLEYWFQPSGGLKAPPRWKMAVVTVLGVWPVSMLVPWLLSPLIASLNPVFQALIIAIFIVIFLTWLVMPILVNLLSRWLKQ